MKNHIVIANLEGDDPEYYYMEADNAGLAAKQVAKDLMSNKPDNECCVHIVFACECPIPNDWVGEQVIQPDEV